MTPPISFLVTAGREVQWERLRAAFADTLTGKPHVMLIAGDAGVGKTALIREFCREVERSNEKVVVACGQCGSDHGDPYLPFIEILGLLTGDVRGDLGARVVDNTNAERLRNIAVTAAQVIVEVGGDLVGILIPGAALFDRVVSLLAKALKVGWVSKLKKEVEKPSPRERFKPEQFFEQFSRVISRLSAQAPLILAVDDLHWADNASLELFLYLARRFQQGNSQHIMLVGTFRPADIRLGRDGGRHPLEGIVNEVRRYWPDAKIDLEETLGGERGLAFVDALIDTEPNLLDSAFRIFLFRRTDGHPLFTVEILRMLKQRGTLIQDSEGRWALARPVTLEELPDSVEAVIEERIQRLERQLREILTCGCVEGEQFTVEIVARVRQVERMQLAEQLNDDLEKRHSLVVSSAEAQAARQHLHTYRFIHAVFQQYLYGTLSDLQRQQLHRAVGEALEALYGSNVSRVVVQLARHFDIALDTEKAIKYLQLAGDQAMAVYAHADALQHYVRAREIISRTGQDQKQEEYRIASSVAQIFARGGRRPEQWVEITRMLELAQALGEKKKVAESFIFQSRYLIETGDYSRAELAANEALMVSNEIKDEGGVAAAWLEMGEAGAFAERPEAIDHLRASSAIWQRLGNRARLADAVRLQALVHLNRNNYPEALARAEEAVALYREVEDRIGEDEALRYIGDIHHARGEYEQALELYAKVLRLRRQTGNRAREGGALGDLGDVHILLGNYQDSLDLHRQSLVIDEDVGYKFGQAWCHHDIGVIQLNLGNHADAKRELERAMDLAVEIGAPKLVVLSKNDLSRALRASGSKDDLTAALQLAREASEESGARSLIFGQVTGRSYQAMAHLMLGDKTEAWEQSRVAITLLEAQGDSDAPSEEIYWNHFVILLALELDEEARKWLKKAYDLVMGKGLNIRDRFYRESFFSRVPLNRQIVDAWNAGQNNGPKAPNSHPGSS